MKATGIVRRMDDLGRVVIPKEIRRTMKIGEGTPLEIFIDKDGGIIFRKYSPVGEMSESAQRMSECVSAMCGAGVAVSDRDRIVAAAGIPKKELVDKPVSKQLEELMRKKKAVHLLRRGYRARRRRRAPHRGRRVPDSQSGRHLRHVHAD